jgi:hypothetical protein
MHPTICCTAPFPQPVTLTCCSRPLCPGVCVPPDIKLYWRPDGCSPALSGGIQTLFDVSQTHDIQTILARRSSFYQPSKPVSHLAHTQLPKPNRALGCPRVRSSLIIKALTNQDCLAPSGLVGTLRLALLTPSSATRYDLREGQPAAFPSLNASNLVSTSPSGCRTTDFEMTSWPRG